MTDPRALREIVDALRILADRAQEAGSPTLRVLINQTAMAARQFAERAEEDKALVPRRPGDGTRRQGEG